MVGEAQSAALLRGEPQLQVLMQEFSWMYYRCGSSPGFLDL